MTGELDLGQLIDDGWERPRPLNSPRGKKPVVSRLWFPGSEEVNFEGARWFVRDLPVISGGADTKISALSAVSTPLGAQEIPVNDAGTTKKLTLTQVRQFIGTGLESASTADQTGFAADTYLAGSSITVETAGSWKAQTQYRCILDMTKTGAGTATPIFTVRMGTLGTTGDAAITTVTFAVGTAVIDTGTFEIWIVFRSVGSGTSAVIQVVAKCAHHLAATGLTTTGASGCGIILATSAGFNSTTQTILGLSFNGGASFSGTCKMVKCFSDNI